VQRRDVPERYVLLGLRVDRHVPGFVDAYYGPTELRERVAAEEPRPPAALVADAEQLVEDVDAAGFEPQRARWLQAQAVALHTVARRLAGEPIGYLEEIELCYGVTPQREPEASFEAAHRALDEALPGDGDVAARYADWSAQSVPADRQLEVLESLSAELRGRVRDLFGLPKGEQVEYATVRNEPWTGFNYYRGGLRSRVVLNTDVPLPPAAFPHFVAHESYPGHHTEHAWKEALFVRERGQLEPAIILTTVPESIVSEGLAELGSTLLYDDVHELLREHLARVGGDYDPDVGRQVVAARDELGAVQPNAALMLHEDGVPREEVRDYLRRWSLAPEARVSQMLDFLTDPVWRTYVPSYEEGERLCRAFVGGDPARFRRLLTEQLTPADLVDRAS
jgi:hypothetical protein